jgi:hypothetical protein
VTWHAQLADYEDVQLRMQRASDLISDGYTPARQAEDQNVRIASVLNEPGGKLDAGIVAVAEGAGHRESTCKRMSTQIGQLPRPVYPKP